MTAAALKAPKFARVLRVKAKLSPEQAEGPADALVDGFDGNLATKADIRDAQADIQLVRGNVETLRVQTRADIKALRLTTKADDIEAVNGAITSAQVESVRWLVGAIGFRTLAVLAAVVALTRTPHRALTPRTPPPRSPAGTGAP